MESLLRFPDSLIASGCCGWRFPALL